MVLELKEISDVSNALKAVEISIGFLTSSLTSPDKEQPYEKYLNEVLRMDVEKFLPSRKVLFSLSSSFIFLIGFLFWYFFFNNFRYQTQYCLCYRTSIRFDVLHSFYGSETIQSFLTRISFYSLFDLILLVFMFWFCTYTHAQLKRVRDIKT